MRHIVNLTIILSLFVQVGFAQTVKTEEEYKVVYDSIVSRLKLAEKDTSYCVGKPVSELVKLLDKYGVKIIQVEIGRYDSRKVCPQYVFGINITFATYECYNFARIHNLQQPYLIIDFEESKPYEKALDLFKKYNGNFAEEVECFYSDAVIKTIGFYFMDNMYSPLYKKEEISSAFFLDILIDRLAGRQSFCRMLILDFNFKSRYAI